MIKMWIVSALVLAAVIIGTTLPCVATDDYRSLERFTDVLAIVKKSYVDEPELRTLLLGAIDGMERVVRAKANVDYAHYQDKKSDYDLLEMYTDALTILNKKFPGVDQDKLIDASITGLLGTLDPQSYYMPPEIFREWKVPTQGSIVGLGVEVTVKEGALTVIAPLEDATAYNAGIRSGDRILKIDGTPTQNLTIMEAVRLMRGAKGTKVVLTVKREGDAPVEVTLTRDIVRINSVKSKMLEDGVGYVRISQFNEKTDDALKDALQEFRKSNGAGNVRGVILDLRDNPGGLLDQAVKVSELFLDEGQLVVSTDGREKDAKMRFTSRRGDKESPYPLVALINGGSASASEIVAGALQGQRRAVIVGSRSFGKGTVQTIIPLDGGAGLRLTTARYVTPMGDPIHNGLKPDFEIKGKDDKDLAVNLSRKILSLAKRSTSYDNLMQIARQVSGSNGSTDQKGDVQSTNAVAFSPLANNDRAKMPNVVSSKASGPSIIITSPDVQRSVKVVAKSSAITVTGQATDDRGVAGVSVNGHQASLDENGNFSAEILLKVGENQITVTAIDTQRNTSTKTFAIKREAEKFVAEIPREEPSQAAIPSIGNGKYYALLIAVQDYASPEINKLDHPVEDAMAVKNLLASRYTFDDKNILLLKNPDRKAISKAFNELRQKLTVNDNLLVFFAGHGIWLDDMKEGYWLPRDASGANDPTDWIPNSTIRNYIRALKARHVLLVADACFSGGIFKVRDAFSRPNASVEKVYEIPSRKAITSGALKTVPDKSVFVEYFLKRLNENRESYLDSQKLFVSFKEAVINNSPNNQTPLYGAISEAGDEGGDFVFVRRGE